MRSILFLLRGFIAWFGLRRSALGLSSLTMLLLVLLPSCGGIGPAFSANTCDTTGYKSGYPGCLPPAGFFCSSDDEQATDEAQLHPSSQYVAQLFPSKESLGGSQPNCPPNATRLVQDQDWKDAKEGAKVLGKRVGVVMARCEHVMERLTTYPDEVFAYWHAATPETLQKVLMACAAELDTIEDVPAYEDPWLAGAALKGFEEGYGQASTKLQRGS